ncbi:MAG: T9SS type A sorting domain-containing protein [Candidatus Cloacimonadales bacterium]
MNKVALLIIQSLILISLHSQVNFELDFSFNNLNPNDELRNLEMFDYNQDGSDELCAGYDGETEWKFVVYNLMGDTLSTLSQPKLENESFQRFHLLHNQNATVLISVSILNGIEYEINDTLLVKVIDLNNSSLISSITYADIEDYGWLDIQSINEITSQQLGESQVIYIGYSYEKDLFGSQKAISDLLKFQFSNSALAYSETVPRAGLSIEYHDDINKFVSLGEYQNSEDIYVTKNNYLKLLEPTSNPSVETILTLTGSAGIDIVSGGTFFNTWPDNFRTLTLNKMDSTGLGSVYYFSEYSFNPSSSQEETILSFISYSPDFSSVEWETNSSYIATSDITASTCISINSQNQYILYFSENKLEIRDIISGDIIHHQDSTIEPLSIQRQSDEELLFITNNLDTASYDVFVLSGEIQVSVEDNQLSTTSFKLSNFPNPFNPTTTIEFSLQQNSKVELSVFNIKGQKVISLVQADFAEGPHAVIWNGDDESGQSVGSGIYYYSLKVNGKTEAVTKCLLLK